MEEYHKFDVTHKIFARIIEEEIELYISKDYVGRLVITEEGRKYDLVYDYVYEDGRIYKLYDRSCPQKQYAEGCDMGWC
ncbi:DUF2553 family protein [Bacillus lacus]|uniref:DUF2553 family protein n=1 Tax=Metabacillus lacus TaxID=1983721 RepID=A0A7X2J2L6_9BACI|nr:DUF2553 family protein [Metabacillus lacus]MRX73962.1 DUF2553 family protein [Metabacillus lacus]